MNKSGAEFSEDGKFRFALWRIWNEQKPLVMFIGLNPSTANENDTPKGNDNTITKVKKIAAFNGYGGFYMMNLFPHVTSNPDKLPEMTDSMYYEQWHLRNAVLTLLINNKKCRDVVFAWGAFKKAKEKGMRYGLIFPEALCLKVNKDGSPKHPLYCRDDSKLIKFNQQ